jgi:hypothetical protein
MSSRRTYDTQIITVRQVNALNFNNSVIDPQRVLTTDGAGGTYWAVPSSLGSFGAVNELIVDNKRVVADLSYNKFYIATAHGMGSIVNPTTKLITLYSKGFDTIDISGANSLYSSSNSVISPTFTLVGGNGVNISSDPITRSIYIQGANPMISTGIYGYSKINVISNASTITANTIKNSNTSILNSLSPSSILSLVGIGDVLLSTNVTQNIVYVGISSFTSRGFNDLSGVAYNAFASSMSTVSTLFANNSTISTLSNSFTSSLISTVGTLEYKIARDAYNVQNNYTNIDLFKLLSSSVLNADGNTATTNAIFNRGILSTVSYASTLNVEAYRGVLNGAVGLDGHFTMSSASFRLDSMSTLLNYNAQISLAYSPSLRFDFNVNVDTLFYVSTLIVCGTSNTSFPLTTFVRPWLVRAGTSLIHLYTDTINTTFSSEMVNNISLTSTFTFLHHVDSFNNITYPGPLNCNADYLISGNNTLSVILTGTNYRSIN